MAPIAGKYQHVENVKFFELMKKAGYPEDKASAADKTRAVVTLTIDGDKVTTKVEEVGDVVENHFVLGQESDEKHPGGFVSKTTITKEGDGLKFVSKESGGKFLTRLYKFTDAGFEVVLNFEGFEAKRIYKRL
ncbi:fatty acid-binding protein [Leptinotarsa decemlineata]|uniref:fatty acid-binding protein n=1 Tax=Leptinotarsa decemlineata TaxID=7539 RepID=UPI000C2529CE|nr:fatty acid-binding protein-like [Leptinotarsa decemlineata]